MKKRFRNYLIFPAIILLFFLNGTQTDAQPNPQQYFYDNLGRLQAVVDSQGNTAIYNYDAVGNLVSILNSSSSTTGVSITYFNPSQGGIGAAVDIFGSGFSVNPSNNLVTFNGSSASVVSSTSTHIVTSVPSGATTGKIQVNNANGSATSVNSFVVSQGISVSVSPAYYLLEVGGSHQFTASVAGTTNQAVVWSIEGPGSMSTSGLYTASSSITQSARILVHARSVVDFNQVATAVIDLVPFGFVGPILSSALSVSINQTTTSSGPFLSLPLSVVVAQPSTTSSGPFISSPLSIAIVPQSVTSSGPFISAVVSVSLTPLISSISPNTANIGTIGLAVTITGTGLTGATGLSFLLNGSNDTTFTASNIIVNASGTSLTASFNIASNAVSGIRVVRVVTPNGVTSGTFLKENTFKVN